jgi:hypothetical protein
MRYRKKPVVIEAVQYDGTFPLEFLGDAEHVRSAGDGALEIVTLEGTMRADVGDWIIRGVKGELYPCKPDIFETTYEPEQSSERPAGTPARGAGDAESHGKGH